MAREPLLMIAFGRKGAGKSYATFELIKKYKVGNPQKGVKPRRVLIFDVNDEYTGIPSISLKDIVHFSIHPVVEVRRIRPFKDGNGLKMNIEEMVVALEFILNNYRNGLLLIEDVNRYISESMPKDIYGNIATQRHNGVDLIAHVQSIGRITPKLWANTTVIRFHKQSESIARHRGKYEEKFEYLSIAENIVNKRYMSGDKYFFLYCDILAEKIYGKFTKEEFNQAVDEYISFNYKAIVRPLLNAVDKNGKKTFTAAKAQEEVKKRLYTSYYGNQDA
jgi:hypothetical protein